MTAEIDGFTGQHRWLSNFVSGPVQLDGELYSTVEHAYQAAKTVIARERADVRACATPGQAKRAGRTVTLRLAWEDARVDVMRNLLRQKFTLAPFRRKLLATGDAELIEGNMWHDNFFGNCQCRKCAMTPGQNQLGQLLMEIRVELRDADDPR